MSMPIGARARHAPPELLIPSANFISQARTQFILRMLVGSLCVCGGWIGAAWLKVHAGVKPPHKMRAAAA